MFIVKQSTISGVELENLKQLFKMTALLVTIWPLQTSLSLVVEVGAVELPECWTASWSGRHSSRGPSMELELPLSRSWEEEEERSSEKVPSPCCPRVVAVVDSSSCQRSHCCRSSDVPMAAALIDSSEA